MGVREVLRVRTYILRSATEGELFSLFILFLFGNVGVDGSQPPAHASNTRDGDTDDISC